MGTQLTWNRKQLLKWPEKCLQCGISQFSVKGTGTLFDVNIHRSEPLMGSNRQTLVKGRARHSFIDACLVHPENTSKKKCTDD
jgi:hypothetical protein